MLTCYNTFSPKEPLYPVMDYTRYGVSEHGTIKGEQAYKEQLVQGGPLACGICSKKLEDYKGGVWMGVGKNCSDHTISIAGYGTTDDGVPYWCECTHALWQLCCSPLIVSGLTVVRLIRNSWGTFWGENGWGRVYRGNNTAGIEESCSWATPILPSDS